MGITFYLKNKFFNSLANKTQNMLYVRDTLKIK